MARVTDACLQLRAAGAEIAYLGAILVPEDEVEFHILAAAEVALAAEVGERAGLRIERVVQADVIGFATQVLPSTRRALPVIELDRTIAHAPGEIGPGSDP